MSEGKSGCGCGGCLLILLIAGLVWFAKDKLEDVYDDWKGDQEAVKEEQREAQLDTQVAVWARENAPELQLAIDDMTRIHAETRLKVANLRRALEQAGREVETDPDLARSEENLKQIASDLEAVKKTRLEAWLDYTKYQANPDPAKERRYQEALQKGKEAGRLARERTQRLLDGSRDGN